MDKREIAKRAQELVDLHGNVVVALAALIEGVTEFAADLRDYVDSKSDAWRENEKNARLIEFLDELESFDIEEPDLPEFDV